MSNLSFNKNSFIKNNPSTLSKPLPQNTNAFGRRTIEEIKTDMHMLNKPKKETENKAQNIQTNLNHLKPLKNWNNK